MTASPIGLKVWVEGIVQGVGFRPFIYSLAVDHHLTGWVRNTSGGVEIMLNGAPENVDAFMTALRANPPSLARLDRVETHPTPVQVFQGFEILASQSDPDQFIPISPDVAICPDCRRELFDPTNRRYRYPFINCTNCGPRFTIIRDIPYDRPKTTMAGFPMCPACRSEYDNPLDRRFHAQPTACPECGPQLYFEVNSQPIAEREDALQMARWSLAKGKIIAIKGLGGFHLACDATNSEAVAELRRRKKRSDKAFALMAFDSAAVERHAHLSPEERALLESHSAPVVLLNRKLDSLIAAECAPGQNTLGFMLPYTPLHLLLLEPMSGFPDALVMTSGNLSEEPIAYSDEDARERLSGMADAFLQHDRPIHMRVDDSVARVFDCQPYLIRRSRGYAPNSIQLPAPAPQILAAGAELKNTFCLTREKYAFISHHIGDLENYETLQSFESGITHFENLFRVKPEAIACDLHPDYLASQYAQQRAQRENIQLIQVQHHHAHLAACLADNGWNSDEPVIGLSYDGTGMGTDGAIWGGEVLMGNYSGYRRMAHLAYVPLPGGDLAVRKPARMALAHLWAAGIEWETDLPPVKALCYEERTALRSQVEHCIASPDTSSMGRLFDAASALIGIRQEATYEGQAAIELEAIADVNEKSFYPINPDNGPIQMAGLWQAIISDWRAGIPTPILAARFHNSIVHLSVVICDQIRSRTGCSTVALSGGVWQNQYLLTRTVDQLKSAQFTVLVHHQVPANDGCIALGQAVVAAHLLQAA